jgi:two-component system copper resistance phosphate regulon response regulator CusR
MYISLRHVHLLTMPHIFLVEDEQRVAAFIKKALEENAYTVDVCGNGAEAIKLFANKTYDLVILDVLLPHLNGVEVCRYIRQKDKDIPVLMLTALGTIDDKVTGLNTGADDYMVKPFHIKELLARIEALLRRKKTDDADNLISLGDIMLNTHSNTTQRAGKKITLTAKEFALLELLMRNPNKILSRQAIAKTVWGIEFDTGSI